MARAMLESAAANGDAGSQFKLGQQLEGTQPLMALSWYERAAEQGLNEAQFATALLYDFGGHTKRFRFIRKRRSSGTFGPVTDPIWFMPTLGTMPGFFSTLDQRERTRILLSSPIGKKPRPVLPELSLFTKNRAMKMPTKSRAHHWQPERLRRGSLSRSATQRGAASRGAMQRRLPAIHT